MRKTCTALLLILALGLSCCGAQPSEPASEKAPTVSALPETETDGAPDVAFTAADREGNTWDESVFAAHSLTMIHFWEPWCGPCVRELPDLERLYEEYADRGLLILGVYESTDMERDVDAVLADAGVTYPILRYSEAFDVFRSGYVPTTVFVDREGHVVGEGNAADGSLYIGSNSFEGWAEIVEGLL